jgi:hypothetical protein
MSFVHSTVQSSALSNEPERPRLEANVRKAEHEIACQIEQEQAKEMLGEDIAEELVETGAPVNNKSST